MLNWCRNRSFHDQQPEISFTADHIPPLCINQTQPQPNKYQIAQYPHLPRANRPEIRKGIKVHFDRPAKTDKEIQVQLPERSAKCLVDCATQTCKAGLSLPNSRRCSTSLMCSNDVSPRNNYENCTLSRVQASKYTHMLASNMPRSIDYKIEVNKQTKHTYGMADTKDANNEAADRAGGRANLAGNRANTAGDRANIVGNSVNIVVNSVNNTGERVFNAGDSVNMAGERANNDSRNRFYSAYGVESCHFPVAGRSDNASRHNRSNGKLAVRFDRSGAEDSMESQLTFSGKYRQMLKNVESEFKLSEKKRSEKKFGHLTPPKRILFNERETIVSKYDHERRDSERSLLIEESIIYEPQIRGYFTPLGPCQQHSYYSMYLARQNLLGMLVSIKEITIHNMGRISEELLLYKELQARQHSFEGVLGLYQTQIDRDSYLLIKEPFTQTLREYLAGVDSLGSVSGQVLEVLQGMEGMGFRLRERLRMEDVVVCMGRVKVQSVGVFTLDGSCGVSVEEAMARLRVEMLEEMH